MNLRTLLCTVYLSLTLFMFIAFVDFFSTFGASLYFLSSVYMKTNFLNLSQRCTSCFTKSDCCLGSCFLLGSPTCFLISSLSICSHFLYAAQQRWIQTNICRHIADSESCRDPNNSKCLSLYMSTDNENTKIEQNDKAEYILMSSE